MLNTINVASSGLAASQEQIENVMNNIANENTPGYKKRVVDISEASHIDARLTGRGVMVGETTRVTNIYLYDNLTEEKGKQSQYDELENMLSDVEAIFHETKDSGFSADLDRYFQALENLRSSPSNEVYKNDLRNTGNVIVDDLQKLYEDLENRETVSYNNLNDHVIELNTVLTDIGSVNKTMSNQIKASNDLLDKRDQLEQEITQYIDISIDRTIDYELKIAGLTAVRFDNNIHKLDLETEYISQKDIYSQFSKFNVGDEVKIDLNNTISVNLTIQDTPSIAEQLKAKIMKTPEIANTVTVTISDTGMLQIESKINGEKGSFDLEFFNKSTKTAVNRDVGRSTNGLNDIHLEIFDREVSLTSGKLTSIVDNLNSTSPNNLFKSYKDKLDNFAKALSDLSASYIQNSDDSYVYGESAVQVDANSDKRVDIGLFSGSDVKSLKFNDGLVSGLTQNKLEYLSSLQWKTDIDIDGTGTNLTSFSKYNQALRVSISDDVENISLKKTTQDAVTASLQVNYDKLVKVDKDEEMMQLIKFQAAYEANAKIITLIDELLNTILNMRR